MHVAGISLTDVLSLVPWLCDGMHRRCWADVVYCML